MRKPKLVYYNDLRHYLMYRFDPPMSRYRFRQPVDEVLGTGVDTLSVGLASGQTFWHDTKVGLKWGERVERHNNGVMWWRAGENLEHALREGIDPLKVVIDRAHEKDLQVLCSLKLNDPSDLESDKLYWLGKLKWDHPEVMIGEEDPDEPKIATCSDYARPEVRQERLDVLEEVVFNYGPDGIELDDCLKDSHLRVFFKPSEARRNIPILTEFIRDVRRLLDHAGESKWGRRLALAMRVHPTEEGNLAAGMDVRSWLAEGLLDFVVPYLGGPHDKLTDSQFSFDWLVEAARASGAWIYSPAGRTPYDDRHFEQTIEMFRATASNLHARGADGLYLEDLKWPHTRDQYMVLREMGDPDIYERKTKHYMFAPGIDTVDSAPLDRPLPVTMTEGLTASIPVYVGDDLDAARADGQLKSVVLGVRIVQTGPDDRFTFRFNGQELGMDHAEVATYYGGALSYSAFRAGLPERIDTYYWYHFHLPLDLVQQGPNTFELTMDKRFAPRVEDRLLQQIELVVKYVEPPVTIEGQM